MKNTSKDESLLTTSSLTIPLKGVCLGISAILLLAGCSMPSSIVNIFGEDRPAQNVGARRAPVYNNSSIKSPSDEVKPEANTKLPPMVTNVSPERVETPIESPYDQYDANGNEVPETEMAQAENKQENSKGFFSGWFGFDDETPKETIEPKQYVEQKVEPTVVRKSFLGNPYRPKGIANPLMESSLSPQSKLESTESKITFVDNTGAEKPPAITVVENTASPESVMAPVGNNVNAANDISQASVVEPSREYNSMPSLDVESQAAPESETLLGSIGSKLDVFELSANEPSKTQKAPEISSVPQRPEAFDAVKREQQQNLNELKQDHSVSKQEKESLEREAPAPSVPATSNQEPSSSVKPLIEEPSAPVMVETKDNVKEELPLVSDVTAPAQPAAEQPAPPAPFLASEKTNMEDDAKPVIVENLEEDKPNFFERLFNKSSEVNSNDEVVSEKIVDNEIPVYSGPVSSLSEVNIEAPPEQNQAETKVIDDLAANAVATAQSAPPPADSSFEPVGDVEQLPSPNIIKTIRPSRYDARRAQASDY